MPSADRCWTSGEVSTAAAALARLITSDARVRRCLDLAARRTPYVFRAASWFVARDPAAIARAAGRR